MKPFFYVRYIDDIFFIWNDGPKELLNFFHLANSLHPSIKFTIESSRVSIPFLDVEVCFKGGRIATKVYSKPTDRHSYLHYRSFHPTHIKKSIVYSQLLRYKRIYSDHSDFVQESTNLFYYLTSYVEDTLSNF